MTTFNIGDKVRLKEHYRIMDYNDRYDRFYDEVSSDIAEWWADNPNGEAIITAFMNDEKHYFAVDDDQEAFDECWLLPGWFELVNEPSPTLRSVEEL